MKKYLISTTILPNATGKHFYEYSSIPTVVKQLDIDGIEFVFLPEWDEISRPLTPTSADYNTIKKIKVHEVAEFIKASSIKVYSVHINRDVGNYLCSNDDGLILRGKQILNENLLGAKELKAELVVIHLWDTYNDALDINKLYKMVYEVSKQYSLKIAYENIPISDNTLSNYKVWKKLYNIIPENHGFTLDLNWCSFNNDFDKLITFIDKIYNIHVQGYLDNNVLKPRFGNLDLLSCLKTLKENNYNNFITLELSKVCNIKECITAINLIRENL